MSQSRSRDASPVRRVVRKAPTLPTKIALHVHIRAEHVENCQHIYIARSQMSQRTYDIFMAWSQSKNIFVDYLCDFDDEGKVFFPYVAVRDVYTAEDRNLDLPLIPMTQLECQEHRRIWKLFCDNIISEPESMISMEPTATLFISTFS